MKTMLLDSSLTGSTDCGHRRSLEPERALVLVVFVLVVLADEVSTGPAVVGRRRGRGGGLGEEGETEGGRGGALLAGGAAVGAVPGADGLQHAPFALLQHVFLWSRGGDVNRFKQEHSLNTGCLLPFKIKTIT